PDRGCVDVEIDLCMLIEQRLEDARALGERQVLEEAWRRRAQVERYGEGALELFASFGAEAAGEQMDVFERQQVSARADLGEGPDAPTRWPAQVHHEGDLISGEFALDQGEAELGARGSRERRSERFAEGRFVDVL